MMTTKWMSRHRHCLFQAAVDLVEALSLCSIARQDEIGLTHDYLTQQGRPIGLAQSGSYEYAQLSILIAPPQRDRKKEPRGAIMLRAFVFRRCVSG